jgi:hypothetical protein
MMLDPTHDSTSEHPYRTAPAPRTFGPESARVPYDGQTRMRLTISSGLAHARIVIDPAARDLVAIERGVGPRPRIRLAAGEIALTWRESFGGWLCNVFTAGLDVFTAGLNVLTAGLDDLAIVLHPAVEWTVAIRGGLSHLECDLTAGAVARIDIAGGCSQVLFDLPQPTAIVPIRISGGASRVGLRRPAEAGVTVGVGGGISMLRVDDRRFNAIVGAARLDTGNVGDGTPHYELSIIGGASDLAIECR